MGKFRKIIVITTVLIIGCIVTYGIVEYNSQKGLKTPTENKRETLAMYIEDESGNYQLSSSKEFPKEGYVLNLEKSSCKNGGVLSQDETTKGINLRTSGSDACNLYFSIEKCPKSSLYATTTLANGLKVYDSSITTYNECNSGEMYTFDHEAATQTTGWSETERRDYRYIGATPNNWVKFNGEDWRIIGVFTVETSSGTKEQLIKIIRNESIGNMSWDDYTDGTSTNEWLSSSLKTLLNGDYYNIESSFNYTYKTSSSDTGTTITIPKGLNAEARSQIEEVKWYLGGANTYRNLGGPDYYSFERGETVYSGRSKSVIAKVGLMYPSDYIYTYANGVDSTCYTDGSNCGRGTPANGWLYNSATQWTISPSVALSDWAFYVYYTGFVGSSYVYYTDGVRPSVYLKSGIKIVGGDGTSSENAYILG